MSKKTDELAASALSGVDVSQKEKGVSSGCVSVFCTLPPIGSPYFLRCITGRFSNKVDLDSLAVGSSMISYPANKTDQIHALSVSEMVRNGQGDVRETTAENYDFQAGERDDGSIMPKSMQELEWADPAEVFEAHQSLEKDFKNSITIKVDADKLQPPVEQPKKPETSQDTSDDKNGSTK